MQPRLSHCSGVYAAAGCPARNPKSLDMTMHRRHLWSPWPSSQAPEWHTGVTGQVLRSTQDGAAVWRSLPTTCTPSQAEHGEQQSLLSHWAHPTCLDPRGLDCFPPFPWTSAQVSLSPQGPRTPELHPALGAGALRAGTRSLFGGHGSSRT